ncbi:MAG TPA: heme lyase CcmF/NrfE family subunit [Alphaproteobacteria bacterium]|jgi:cytochrome c-type biogenesis protein CcmF|nr:heme lyase CcmF/NrfE family subunit [Alphaproteobacteria bacterium]
MIAEIGQFALVLAFLVALVQGTLPLVGAARGEATLMALARPAALAQFLFVATAFVALTWAFVVSDFSVALVAEYSHSTKPMIYKLSGVWGNHEGSMLLWVLILTLFGAVLAAFGVNLPPALRARALAVQGLIGFAFLAFILFTSNPFTRLVPAPADGNGFNPLLQDPGLAFHPPFLYLGYVGFSMAFSFAIAALIEGRIDAAWARWVRPWTLAAWSFLTVGIAMGSWWAYYELGWGGWWFWDPVENASFMPWLVGTALLHSAIVVEKRDTLKSWAVLLAILTFSLSLIGTFLVRSGVLTSVHAFATDPARGLFILGFLVVAIGGSLALYAWRAPTLVPGGSFLPLSREGALVLNNVLLVSAAAAVFLGTLYPLVLEALGGDKISVGSPYFRATFVPIMVPLLAALAVGPLLSWKRGDLAAAIQRLRPALIAAALIIALSLFVTAGADALAALGLGLAAWLFVGALVEWSERIKLLRVPARDSLRLARNLPRAAYGMTVAHIGVAIAVAGITASSAWQSENILSMRPGDKTEIAGYGVAFDGVERVRGPNYVAERGRFAVTEGGAPVAVMTPEKRVYLVERSTTTEAAIHTTWFADLYVVLGDPDKQGGWAVRLYHNPLVPWIWTGALVMFAGGLLSLSDRRLRVGAPRRSRRGAAAPDAAPARA